MTRILFITSTRIGDAVISTSALAAAQARLPDAALTIACGPLAAPLFAAEPRLEALHVLDKADKAYWLKLWAKLSGVTFDLAIDLRGSATTWLLRARRRIVNRGSGAGQAKAQELAALMGESRPHPPRLHTSAAAEAAAADVHAGAGFLALGPGANFMGKRWPPERFAELAARVCGPGGLMEGRPVLVLGGPEDRAIAAAVAGAAPGGVDVAGRLDLLASAALLKRAGLFVGNDSGLMHIAAAMGAPTVGLFGPSNEGVYAPTGAHALAVRGPTPYHPSQERDAEGGRALMAAIVAEAVVEACAKLSKHVRVA